MNRDLKINVVCEGQVPFVKTLGEVWLRTCAGR